MYVLDRTHFMHESRLVSWRQWLSLHWTVITESNTVFDFRYARKNYHQTVLWSLTVELKKGSNQNINDQWHAIVNRRESES